MRDAVARQEVGQDVLGKVRLALIEIAGDELDRQQAAPFEIEQCGQETVGILAARQGHQPPVAGAHHGEIVHRLPGLAQDALAQLVELDAGRRIAKHLRAAVAFHVGTGPDIGLMERHGIVLVARFLPAMNSGSAQKEKAALAARPCRR